MNQEQNNNPVAESGDKVDRKEFLKFGALAALGTAIGLGAQVATGRGASAAGKENTTSRRLGLAIDMSKCKEGCNDCITACHSTHNVPDMGDSRVEIKWLWKEKFPKLFAYENHPYLPEETKEGKYLALCNHCANPPCVRVCPTKATFKRNSDGIVMMDFHRCIGCRFCMAGCPYGSRSFNYFEPRDKLSEVNPDFPTRTIGVVEKCNLCNERIDKGGIPACVEVCPEQAIVFGDLNDPSSPIREVLENNNTLRRRPGLGTQPSVFYKV